MMTDQEKQVISNRMTVVNDTYKASGKEVIIASSKIDLKAFHWKIKSTTVDLIYNATSTFITAEGITDVEIHNKAWNLMDHHGDLLFKHHKATKAEVMQAYLDKYQLEDNPQVIDLPDLTAEYMNAEAQEQARQRHQAHSEYPEMKGNLKLKKVLEDTLVIPYDQFIKQIEQNNTDLALKQKLVALLEGGATEDATMELDNEMPTDRRTLELLLDERSTAACNKATSPLKKQIAQLKKQLAKEDKKDTPNPRQRGRGKGGASNKKKSGKQQNPKNNRGRSNSRGKSPGSNRSGSRGTATGNSNSQKRSKSKSRSKKNNKRSGTRGNKS